MDMNDLKLFIDVYRFGNMTTAAKHFYLTQSTVSKRLHALEREIGARLFDREKGERQVKPTVIGESFYGIAERMLALHGQALQLCEEPHRSVLTLACMNSAQCYTLPPFLLQFQRKHPEMQFNLEDHHSIEIFQLLDRGFVDLGVTQTPSPYPNLRSALLYEETYRVVQRMAKEGFAESIHPCSLKSENEIYQAFCDDLNAWRNRWFPPYSAKVCVNTTATAMRYLTEAENWMIVPQCIAEDLERSGFVSYALEGDPPLHKAYLVWREDNKDEALHLFIESMKSYFDCVGRRDT